jgi:1-acyl-sn-glycerol-3-phosphate acyltransferase
LSLIYAASLRALKSLLLPFWVPNLEGTENIPLEGPLILVCNHPTVLDGLVLGSVLPRKVRFLVSTEPLKVPVVGWWLRALGFIPVGRGEGAMDRTLEALRNGDCVGFYPEADPTHCYELQPFPTGVALVGEWTRAPVVPVTIYGSEQLCSADCNYVSGGHVWITFGKPLYWQEGEATADFLERMRQAVGQPLKNPPAPRARPRTLSHWLCTALWTPASWALLKLADFVRPGGKR